MNFKQFVCPHNRALLDRLRGHVVAVHVDDPVQVLAAADDVAKSGNELLCVIFESKSLLDAMELREEWKNIRIVLRSPGLGKFRKLAGRLALWRKLGLQVFLPCRTENLVELRILASVGISCGVTFGEEEPDWEALADLMTYAILGPVPHAPIEPFAFIAHHYQPAVYTKWDSVYFDDPSQFLHLDSEGHVALSRRELFQREFIAREIAQLDIAAEVPVIADRLDHVRQMFLNNHPCSICASWRLCLGKFARNGSRSDGCSEFFAELMEVVEQFQTQGAGQRKVD